MVIPGQPRGGGRRERHQVRGPSARPEVSRFRPQHHPRQRVRRVWEGELDHVKLHANLNKQIDPSDVETAITTG
jgi:hypothetical protein